MRQNAAREKNAYRTLCSSANCWLIVLKGNVRRDVGRDSPAGEAFSRGCFLRPSASDAITEMCPLKQMNFNVHTRAVSIWYRNAKTLNAKLEDGIVLNWHQRVNVSPDFEAINQSRFFLHFPIATTALARPRYFESADEQKRCLNLCARSPSSLFAQFVTIKDVVARVTAIAEHTR